MNIKGVKISIILLSLITILSSCGPKTKDNNINGEKIETIEHFFELAETEGYYDFPENDELMSLNSNMDRYVKNLIVNLSDEEFDNYYRLRINEKAKAIPEIQLLKIEIYKDNFAVEKGKKPINNFVAKISFTTDFSGLSQQEIDDKAREWVNIIFKNNVIERFRIGETHLEFIDSNTKMARKVSFTSHLSPENYITLEYPEEELSAISIAVEQVDEYNSHVTIECPESVKRKPPSSSLEKFGVDDKSHELYIEYSLFDPLNEIEFNRETDEYTVSKIREIGENLASDLQINISSKKYLEENKIKKITIAFNLTWKSENKIYEYSYEVD